MARIAFVQRLWTDNLGIMGLAALLREAGHRAQVHVWQGQRTLRALRRFRPDLVGFSVITGDHPWYLQKAVELKAALACSTIFGGPHPTFFPEVLKEPGLDYICRGEGEDAILGLAAALDRGQPPVDVANLSHERDGEWIENPVGPVREDLDALPHPSRDHYDTHPMLASRSMGFFMAGRGCPYSCTFCFNKAFRELLPTASGMVRMRSPSDLLDEIEAYRARFRLERVNLQDDVLTLDRKWFAEFAAEYRTRCGLPLHCNVRADRLDASLVRLLREANCETVAFGIESGSERLRNGLLGKALPEEDIVRAGRLLHDEGIRFKTYNMMGLPGETLEEAWQTVELNQRIQTDYPWCSLYAPYPGTLMGDQAIASGLVSGERPVDRIRPFYLKESLLEQPEIEQVVNLQRFFPLIVRRPALRPLVERLIQAPPNPAFDLLHSGVHGYLHLYRLFHMGKAEFLQLSGRTVGAWIRTSR